MSDMTVDLFAEHTCGKIALQKLGSVHEDFRLYKGAWLGEGNEHDIMAMTGGVFRKALRGTNKGKLSVLLPDTSRTVYITVEEMDNFEKKDK